MEIPQTLAVWLSNACFAGLRDLFYHSYEIYLLVLASLALSFVH